MTPERPPMDYICECSRPDGDEFCGACGGAIIPRIVEDARWNARLRSLAFWAALLIAVLFLVYAASGASTHMMLNTIDLSQVFIGGLRK